MGFAVARFALSLKMLRARVQVQGTLGSIGGIGLIGATLGSYVYMMYRFGGEEKDCTPKRRRTPSGPAVKKD